MATRNRNSEIRAQEETNRQSMLRFSKMVFVAHEGSARSNEGGVAALAADSFTVKPCRAHRFSLLRTLPLDYLSPREIKDSIDCEMYFNLWESLKHLKFSRAYIDFNKPEDVIEFAEFFNGHVFVNEKGTQFKAIVEYAPSQRVPKQWSKKDGREGTLLKDPEYIEFLEYLAKPVENLPSAEIQLERKEAERAGAPKDVPIVTPLMDYVRQKRAAKGGARRTMLNGKSTRRVGGMSSRSSVSGSSKRGSGKRSPTTMFVLRESSKDVGTKDKSTYLGAVSSTDALEGDIVFLYDANGCVLGRLGSTENGKKKILLLKGKVKEISNVSGGSALQQNAASPAKNSNTTAPLKQNQQRDADGRIIRSILLNRDTRQKQPLSGPQSELRILPSNQERDKRPPRPQNVQSIQTNGNPEDKVVNNDLQAIRTEKQERRTRNKDRPDRGVWTPLRRSDGPHASDESLSSSTPQISQVVDFGEGGDTGKEISLNLYLIVCTFLTETITFLALTFSWKQICPKVSLILYSEVSGFYNFSGTHGDVKHDMLVTRGGSYKPGGRRGSAYSIKDADGSSVEGKSLKRGGSGYGSLEVDKFGSKNPVPVHSSVVYAEAGQGPGSRALRVSILDRLVRCTILVADTVIRA
ncbi:hypothetical protein RD792_002007 [Penstemon davidsonii]|uniref:UPF3 domain-containing protein n=1 Tax=Penstemon davidsonii TaxID=160366 RepID=A0ABR0DQL5_9LAMI|nr:hypothetical protein RD792_002007 [Penstemon davidsonii]